MVKAYARAQFRHAGRKIHTSRLVCECGYTGKTVAQDCDSVGHVVNTGRVAKFQESLETKA